MKRIAMLTLMGMTGLFTACAPSFRLLKPKQEPGFSLNSYRSYNFFDVDTEGIAFPERLEQHLPVIRRTIAAQLEKRGLTTSPDPDLKVNLAISVKEEVQTRQTDFRTDGYPRYMGQRRYTWKSEEVEVGRYRQGTLLIELVDAKSNHLVWQGGGEGVVSDKKDMSQGIGQMVNEIMEKIP